MIDIVINLLTAVISILPVSPFAAFIAKVENMEGLSYLNWFIPFYIFKDMMAAWCLCMFAYMQYRWLKSNALKH